MEPPWTENSSKNSGLTANNDKAQASKLSNFGHWKCHSLVNSRSQNHHVRLPPEGGIEMMRFDWSNQKAGKGSEVGDPVLSSSCILLTVWVALLAQISLYFNRSLNPLSMEASQNQNNSEGKETWPGECQSHCTSCLPLRPLPYPKVEVYLHLPEAVLITARARRTNLD